MNKTLIFIIVALFLACSEARSQLINTNYSFMESSFCKKYKCNFLKSYPHPDLANTKNFAYRVFLKGTKLIAAADIVVFRRNNQIILMAMNIPVFTTKNLSNSDVNKFGKFIEDFPLMASGKSVSFSELFSGIEPGKLRSIYCYNCVIITSIPDNSFDITIAQHPFYK